MKSMSQSSHDPVCKVQHSGWWIYAVISGLLTAHVALLAYSATIRTPCIDEVGHLPSGIAHWDTGIFDLYRVNPPLVRMVATSVAFANGVRVSDIGGIARSKPGSRREFVAGHRWITQFPTGFLNTLVTARLVCIGFSVFGAMICYRLSSTIYGRCAGLAAMTMWCVSPLILGHGSLITPDVPCAAFALLAVLTYRCWQKTLSYRWAVIAGFMTGLAVLAKMTNLFLGPILFLTVAACIIRSKPAARKALSLQCMVVIVTAVYCVNLAYGSEERFRRLGSFQFISEFLGGPDVHITGTGNRFSETLLGSIPVPVPTNFVYGIDVQKKDFEDLLPSYLAGTWKRGGWLHYYAYAFVVKEPVGLLIMFVLTLPRLRRAVPDEWLYVIGPAAGYFIFVSSQTGFNHHLRYISPAYAFMLVFLSSNFVRSTQQIQISSRFRSWLIRFCLIASAIESLSVYPHSISFFNVASGGPLNGPQHLLHSNVDWGQGLLQMSRWSRAHPEAVPLMIAFSAGIPASALPIWGDGVECGEPTLRELTDPKERRYYAYNVSRLYDQPLDDPIRRHLRNQKPFDVVGYTFYVYRVEPGVLPED